MIEVGSIIMAFLAGGIFALLWGRFFYMREWTAREERLKKEIKDTHRSRDTGIDLCFKMLDDAYKRDLLNRFCNHGQTLHKASIEAAIFDFWKDYLAPRDREIDPSEQSIEGYRHP